MIRKAFLALVLLASTAHAQTPVKQNGNITPGHLATWTTNGIIQDGGNAANGVLTSLGITGQGKTLCLNSATITGPYNQLCFAVNTAGAAQISLQNLGGASAESLQFVINGTTLTLPSSPGNAFATVNLPVTAAGDATCIANTSGALKDCGAALTFTGGSSGTVTFGVAAAAGTWSMILPTSGGSNGQFLKTDGSGNTTWANAPGSGTINSGTAGQLTWYATTGTAVSGNASTSITNGALTLGVANTTLGQLILEGSTSGAVTLTPQATAGTPTITFGTSSGTPVVTASAPLSITAATGNLTITGGVGQVLAGAGPAFTATPTLGSGGATTGQLQLANGGAGGAVVTVQNNGATSAYNFNLPTTAGTANQVLQSQGGTTAAMTWSTATYPATTTINQVLYSSANNVIAGLATANGGVLNTGTSGIPAITATPTLGVAGSMAGTLSLSGVTSGTVTIATAVNPSVYTFFLPSSAGVANQVLTSGAGSTVQSYQNIASLLTNGTGISITGTTNATVALAGVPAWMLLGNATVGNVAPAPFSISSLVSKPSPAGTDLVLIQDQAASGAFKSATIASIASAGSVASVGSLTGAVGLLGLTTNANNILPVGDPGSITNCVLSASVAASNLTISLLTQASSTPTSTNPCLVSFRNATAATGDFTLVQVTAATTVTFNAGSTFGVLNSTASCAAASSCPFRVWVVGMNNAGTVVLGAAVVTSAAGVKASILNEGVVQSSTACNACNTATALSTLYSTNAQTSTPIRILGYLEWGSGLGTAGTYASGPTSIQLMTPSVKKPGDVVQTVFTTTTSPYTASSNAFSGTVGGQSAAITPTSTANPILVTAQTNVYSAAPTTSLAYCAMVRGTASTTPIAPEALLNVTVASGSANMPASFMVLDTPGSLSAQTYNLKVKNSDNATVVGCPNNNASQTSPYGTTMLQEIQG